MTDFLATVPKCIDGLLDGRSRVVLHDVMPRLCPEGRTPEFRIVEAARCSLDQGLKSIKEDEALIRYLWNKNHTSPFEQAVVTFRLYIPKFVSIQLLRHRTARLNEFSQRYAEVSDEMGFYHASEDAPSVRLQSKTNKQASVAMETADPEVSALFQQAEALTEQQHVVYRQLLAKGVARETARVSLPIGEQTVLMYQMDVNNLLKMISLRDDIEHAQYQTAIIAGAMRELARPLFPVTFACFEERRKGIFLSTREIQVLAGAGEVSMSQRERKELEAKRARLNLPSTSVSSSVSTNPGSC